MGGDCNVYHGIGVSDWSTSGHAQLDVCSLFDANQLHTTKILKTDYRHYIWLTRRGEQERAYRPSRSQDRYTFVVIRCGQKVDNHSHLNCTSLEHQEVSLCCVLFLWNKYFALCNFSLRVRTVAKRHMRSFMFTESFILVSCVKLP